MSDFTIKPQNFMIIRGIKLENLQSIEDMFDEKIAAGTQRLVTVYRANPPVFKDIANWPRHSNCKCWFCHKFFEDMPWALPHEIKGPIDVQNPEFLVRGNFCSVNCALAFLNEETRGSQERECRKRLLRVLCRCINPRMAWPPTPTPNVISSAEYSGENGLYL